MKICRNCGVQLEGDPTRCPLCGAVLTAIGGPGAVSPDDRAVPSQHGEADRAASEHAHADREASPEEADERRKARFWLWEMFTIVVVAISIIVAATDFAYGFDVSWSAYPLTALAFIWILVSAILALRKDIPLAYAAVTADVLAYLLVLDALIPGDPWFGRLALPVTLLVSGIGAAAVGTIRGFKLGVFHTLAAAVVFTGVFLVGLQIVLYFALELESILSWSIVALGGCLSIALLLWIINRRLRERHSDFKRVFHL